MKSRNRVLLAARVTRSTARLPSVVPERKARPRRRRNLITAIVVSFTLLIAGCQTLSVSSTDGVLSVNNPAGTPVYWFFFDQNFKDFALSRTSDASFSFELPSDAYNAGSVSHPGLKYFAVEQIQDSFSSVVGSGPAASLILRPQEFANQGDGLSLHPSEDITMLPAAFGFSWLTGGYSTTVDPRDLCGLFVMAISDYNPLLAADRFFYEDVVATTATYSCDAGGSINPEVPASGVSAGAPGILLHIAGAKGRAVAGTTVIHGSSGIAPHSSYTLSIQDMNSPAWSKTVLATGVTNGRGHVEGRIQLGALAPGSYRILMTGSLPLGYPLVLTNHIVVDPAGKIVSVSAESQQPFLN